MANGRFSDELSLYERWGEASKQAAIEIDAIKGEIEQHHSFRLSRASLTLRLRLMTFQ
jgi:hypothetical protein